MAVELLAVRCAGIVYLWLGWSGFLRGLRSLGVTLLPGVALPNLVIGLLLLACAPAFLRVARVATSGRIAEPGVAFVFVRLAGLVLLLVTLYALPGVMLDGPARVPAAVSLGLGVSSGLALLLVRNRIPRTSPASGGAS